MVDIHRKGQIFKDIQLAQRDTRELPELLLERRPRRGKGLCL